MNENNPQAFPSKEIDYNASANHGTTVYDNHHAGMTLRDYFAAKAMPKSTTYTPAGLKNWIKWFFGYDYTSSNVEPEESAKKSYQLADAMLKERMKPIKE
jgi:hypothetical protein